MTTVSDLVWRCKPSNVLLIIGNIQSCTSVPSNAFLVSLVLAIPSVCPCCSTSSGNSVLHPYSGSTSQCCFMLMLDPEAKERRSGRFRHLAWSPMVPVVICSKLSGSNDAILWVHSYLYYWLVGWNLFYFSICIGKNIPNWLIMTSIFQSGWNHQPVLHFTIRVFLKRPGYPKSHEIHESSSSSAFNRHRKGGYTMRGLPPFQTNPYSKHLIAILFLDYSWLTHYIIFEWLVFKSIFVDLYMFIIDSINRSG